MGKAPKFPVFERFNKLWVSGHIDKPLIILLGGYSGTGKSTFAKKLQSLLPSLSIIPTGVIRAVYYPPLNTKGEIFSCHTYDLYKYSKSDKELFNNYLKQARALYKPIANICNFAKTERQNFIIEGNHIFPELKTFINNVNCFDFYLRIDNGTQLIRNMQSHTHRRKLNKKQVETAVRLNRFLTQKLSKTSSVFNFNEEKKILEYLANNLEDLL